MTDIMNGAAAVGDLNELQELAARDIQRVAARQPAPAPAPVAEMPAPSAAPFDQKEHDRLLKSLDQFASDCASEMEHVRSNSKVVEQLVMERTAKIKADITSLYLLGAAARAEAKRGDEVNERLADELDRMMEPRAA